MPTPKTPFIRWLQFLGRVQFTTALLLGGVLIMTVGTIIESRGSREIPRLASTDSDEVRAVNPQGVRRR